MEAREPVIRGYFHSANDEMLLLMAARSGYRATLERHPEMPEWSAMTFERLGVR
jgi:hypothetical protein